MPELNCPSCKYSTERRSSFRIHIGSKAHEEQCKKSLHCPTCLKQFTVVGPYSRHVNACVVNLLPKKFDRKVKEKSEPDHDHYDPNAAMSIKDLYKKEFTTKSHKMCLSQMMTERTNILDYLEKIDCIIEAAKLKHDKEQKDDYACGDIKKIREYTLPIQRFYDYLMTTICESTTGLVITHIDLSMDGNSRHLLFKHEGMLRSDIIIRDIAKQSRFEEYIAFNDNPLPDRMPKYNDLLDRLRAIAFDIKNEYNITRRKVQARRRIKMY